MDEKTIVEALKKGERVTLECKKAKSEIPSSVWSTYSSFANTEGGLILLGVNEDLEEPDIAKRFTITGVNNVAKMKKDFWDTVNNASKVNVNILKDSDVDSFELEGKTILAIQVPRADYTIRPVFINNNMMRGTYMRNHEGDYHCSEDIIRMMLRYAFPDGNDRMFRENYTMEC